ncbi:MAG: DEAD/DEAH box helicase [Breznakibacter sp.]
MEQLSIILTEKKNLGYVAIPFMVSLDNAPALTLIEQVLPQHIAEGKYPFTGIEKEIIESLYKINEQSVFKRFSKEKTLKSFFDKLTDDMINKHIRPFIEEQLAKSFDLIAASSIPIFIKMVTYSNLYISDQVSISAEHSKAVFHFSLNPEELSYTLRISESNKELNLFKRDISEITANPATLLINHHLYRFKNIDSKKFKPFVEKNKISVPGRSVEKYMSSFVENCVRDHEVSATGFDIKGKEVDRKAILSLENDLSMQAVLVLKFQYEQRKYLAGTKSSIFVDLKNENDRYVFYKFNRDKEWEEDIISLLKNMGLKHSVNCNFKPETINSQTALYNIIEWINENGATLTQEGIDLIQTGFKEPYYTGEVKLDFRYKTEEDWFDIQALVILDEFQIPFVRFRKNIISGNREYKLPNGKIFVMPEEWFSRYTDLMQFAKENDDHIILDKMHFSLFPSDDEMQTDKNWDNKLSELANFTQNGLLEQPRALKAQMRPYQLEGYAWMSLLHKHNLGGILADDMGLGKTLQTIALLTDIYECNPSGEEPNCSHDMEAPAAKQATLIDNAPVPGFNQSSKPATLIVMPTSLIHNWENEIRKFAPHLKVYLYTGNSRLKSNEIGKILRHYHVVLTTYGILRNDLEYLSNYNFLYLILDESQNIKNPSSKIYHAVTEIQATHKLVLSGTPIENSLTDLWAQMTFVNRGLLGNQNFFRNHFEIPITKNKDESKEIKLRKIITPFILRRTKEMVAKDLPPITEQVLYCEMTPEQKKVYEKERSGIRNEILKNLDYAQVHKVSFMALQALTRLRLIANHPRLCDPHYTASSGKFEQILEHIDNIIADKHKLLIFSSFVKDIELIEVELKKRGHQYSKLTGATTDRQKVIDNFTKDENCKIFLISLKAGGVGLNLTQADYVFVLNPWWNPAAEAQAINRAHRIGQTKNVFVYKFITTDSIEEKIAKLQEKKLLLANSFITSDNPLKDLTADEIKALFE